MPSEGSATWPLPFRLTLKSPPASTPAAPPLTRVMSQSMPCLEGQDVLAVDGHRLVLRGRTTWTSIARLARNTSPVPLRSHQPQALAGGGLLHQARPSRRPCARSDVALVGDHRAVAGHHRRGRQLDLDQVRVLEGECLAGLDLANCSSPPFCSRHALRAYRPVVSRCFDAPDKGTWVFTDVVRLRRRGIVRSFGLRAALVAAVVLGVAAGAAYAVPPTTEQSTIGGDASATYSGLTTAAGLAARRPHGARGRPGRPRQAPPLADLLRPADRLPARRRGVARARRVPRHQPARRSRRRGARRRRSSRSSPTRRSARSTVRHASPVAGKRQARATHGPRAARPATRPTTSSATRSAGS